jgi:hypothetical protein
LFKCRDDQGCKKQKGLSLEDLENSVNVKKIFFLNRETVIGLDCIIRMGFTLQFPSTYTELTKDEF